MPFGGTPYPRRFGGKTTRLSVLLAAVNRARGSAYNTTDWSSNVYAENAATARVLDLIWSTNGRVANAYDPLRMTAAGTLGRWETILGVSPSSADSEPVRRARVQAIRGRDGNGSALISYVQSQLQAALGSSYVALETISYANANIHVPDATYPWGTVATGSPWSSSVAHVLVRTKNPYSGTAAEAQFYQTVSQVAPLLDSILPSWVTYDWYRPGPIFSNVTGGPSAGGFYLDDPHNLDNEVFDLPSNTAQPVITSITASSGSTAGGVGVTISGSAFTGAFAGSIGGAALTSFSVINDTTISCVTPAGTAGQRTVAVWGPGGYGRMVNGYTYTAGAAPTLTSVLSATGSFATGDIGGGYSVNLTGTNFTGTTGVTFAGTAATSVVVNSAVSITCTVPAGTSGAASVIVTNPSGSNGANTLWTYYSPAQEALAGWWRGSFANPWTPTASAGASFTNGNLTNGVAPTTGTLNSLTTAIFDGTTQYLNSASNASVLLSGGATPSSIWVLARSISQPATSGFPYSDPCLLCLSLTAIRVILSYSSSGVQGTVYNAGYNSTTAISFTNNVYHLFQFYWDGIGNTYCRVDGGSFQSVAVAGPDTMAGTGVVNVATNYNAPSVFANCEIVEIGMDNGVAYGSTGFDKVRAYAATRYGVAV